MRSPSFGRVNWVVLSDQDPPRKSLTIAINGERFYIRVTAAEDSKVVRNIGAPRGQRTVFASDSQSDSGMSDAPEAANQFPGRFSRLGRQAKHMAIKDEGDDKSDPEDDPFAHEEIDPFNFGFTL